MKTFHFLLISPFIIFMFACQSAADEFGIGDYGNNYEDKKLSHKPTGKEHEKIADQSVIIDFSPDAIIAESIFYRKPYYDNDQVFERNLFDAFPTVGQLMDYYDRCQLGYNIGYSNYMPPSYFQGEIVYPPIEYALAQECYREDCPTDIRKAVLRMALDKHERKTSGSYLNSHTARRTGLFLMAVILVKEKDADFLTAVRENKNVQNTLRLNLDTESQLNMIGIGNAIDPVVCKFAENFLSKKLNE